MDAETWHWQHSVSLMGKHDGDAMVWCLDCTEMAAEAADMWVEELQAALTDAEKALGRYRDFHTALSHAVDTNCSGEWRCPMESIHQLLNDFEATPRHPSKEGE